jgi:hypothetical protein
MWLIALSVTVANVAVGLVAQSLLKVETGSQLQRQRILN